MFVYFQSMNPLKLVPFTFDPFFLRGECLSTKHVIGKNLSSVYSVSNSTPSTPSTLKPLALDLASTSNSTSSLYLKLIN